MVTFNLEDEDRETSWGTKLRTLPNYAECVRTAIDEVMRLHNNISIN